MEVYRDPRKPTRPMKAYKAHGGLQRPTEAYKAHESLQGPWRPTETHTMALERPVQPKATSICHKIT